ncbi:MAG: phosphatase PAP2 family protein [Terriglobales bacterium]
MSTFELHPTFCFTLLGTFVIYAWTRPSRPAWLAVLVIAAGLRTACAKLMGGLGTYYGVWWISWGAFLGLASLMVLAAQVVRSRGLSSAERKFYRSTFYAGAVFPLCSLLIGYTVPLSVWLRPRTYDAFLLAFDSGLGFQPSFILGRLLLKSSHSWGLTTVIYYVLALITCILYASYLAAGRAHKRQPVMILALLLSLMVVGSAEYLIYPAVGPGHAFGDLYPRTPPLLTQITIQPMAAPDAPRNCMPSLHLAGALVIWWNSCSWPRWGRWLAGLFVWATIFATLALGEHYLVDLVVAVPFTLVFQALWTVSIPLAQPARRTPLVVGIVLNVAWLVSLRYGLRVWLISPLISWGLILLTVAWCLVLQRRLSNTAWRSVRDAGDRADSASPCR